MEMVYGGSIYEQQLATWAVAGWLTLIDVGCAEGGALATSACESMRRALMSLDETTQRQYTRKRQERIELDTPCKGKESIFNSFVYLRRGFDKFDPEFFRKLTALIFCYSPLVRPVRLVANENLVHTLRSMLLDVSVPGANIYARVGLDQRL